MATSEVHNPHLMSCLVMLAVFAGASPAQGACDLRFELETPAGERSSVASGSTTTISVRALYSLSFVIPVTDWFLLKADVRIQGEPWDNDKVVVLQPMNKLVWKEDYDICALVAAGIFRATEPGTFRVTVSYQDEGLSEPVVLELMFRAE